MNYTNAGYIYAIQNTVNGGMYIGSTIAYKSRWGTHKSSLRRGKHHSFVLQKAWDKYGEAAFRFKILLVCPKEMRIEYENLLMPLQRYNVLRTAKEHLVRGGWKHSQEFKDSVSKRFKGKKLSQEHVEKVKQALKDKARSESFKLKARNRQLGVTPSDNTRARLSEALVKARHQELLQNQDIARKIHSECMNGETVSSACKKYGTTPTTFYKHLKLLALPLLGHKKRGGVL